MNSRTRLLLPSFILLGCINCFAQNELVFPVVAYTSTSDCANACRYWASFTRLFNPNDTPTTLTITSYDASGNVVSSSGPLTAPAFQGFAPPPASVLRTGWLRITSSQPLIAREILQYSSVVPGKLQDLRSELFLAPASLSRRHFVSALSFGEVGLSMVFPSVPGSAPAKGKLIHRNDDGGIISEKDLILPANGQWMGYLKDLLPPEPGNNLPLPLFGSFEIVFDQNVAVTALQFAASEPIEEVVVETFSGDLTGQ